MRFVILILAVGVVVYGFSRLESPPGGTSSGVAELDWQEHQSPLDQQPELQSPSVREAKIKKLSHEIAKMRQELQSTDQELRNAGFPDVLLDKRLSETERARILDKVKLSSEIQTKLSRLQILKVDIEHSTL